MQPAMGSGIAGYKTLDPMKIRIRSVTNHAVFGLGLFMWAYLIAWVLP
jgi:phage shock protein PspC (stress-responsive transcriptional regulator)